MVKSSSTKQQRSRVSHYERLKAGDIPIYEPGLTELVTQNVASGCLRFTTDSAKAVKESELLFIAVGTPPDEDGSADLRHVLAVVAINLSLIKIAKRKVKPSLLALLSRSDKSSPN